MARLRAPSKRSTSLPWPRAHGGFNPASSGSKRANRCVVCGAAIDDRVEPESAAFHRRCWGEYLRASVRDYRRARQQATVKGAKRSREPWTPPEDDLILDFELSVYEIALRLGRTAYAVEQRRDRLLRRQNRREASA